MSIYDRMADVSRRLLSNDKFGQGVIQLVRYTPGADPVDPWSPPLPPVRTVIPITGAARGVSKELIGTPVDTGGQIVGTDLMVITPPIVGGYDPADVLEIDGKPVTILSVQNIPAAGTVSAVRFIVRA